MNPADPLHQFGAALADQAAALERLVMRLDAVHGLLPPIEPGRWRGPASASFAWALDSVHSEIGSAVGAVDDAARETRRALAAVNARV